MNANQLFSGKMMRNYWTTERDEDETDEVRCAPIAFASGRERLMSRLRSAVSPWVDCRNEFDKARDRIAELAE
jgi:hypothetical protein